MWDWVQGVLAEAYPWVKAVHVMAVIAWMAGLFYLPRLFVYHVEGYEKRGVVAGSEMDLLFQRQERLLLRAIMNPSALVAWVCGLCLVLTPGIVDWGMVWPWAKAGSVLAMTWFHHWLARRRMDFLGGQNTWTGRQYRMMNEVPTLLMVVIVLSVIVKF
jgi:protoporphyrinogen IX oxidase